VAAQKGLAADINIPLFNRPPNVSICVLSVFLLLTSFACGLSFAESSVAAPTYLAADIIIPLFNRPPNASICVLLFFLLFSSLVILRVFGGRPDGPRNRHHHPASRGRVGAILGR